MIDAVNLLLGEPLPRARDLERREVQMEGVGAKRTSMSLTLGDFMPEDYEELMRAVEVADEVSETACQT